MRSIIILLSVVGGLAPQQLRLFYALGGAFRLEESRQLDPLVWWCALASAANFETPCNHVLSTIREVGRKPAFWQWI